MTPIHYTTHRPPELDWEIRALWRFFDKAATSVPKANPPGPDGLVDDFPADVPSGPHAGGDLKFWWLPIETDAGTAIDLTNTGYALLDTWVMPASRSGGAAPTTFTATVRAVGDDINDFRIDDNEVPFVGHTLNTVRDYYSWSFGDGATNAGLLLTVPALNPAPEDDGHVSPFEPLRARGPAILSAGVDAITPSSKCYKAILFGLYGVPNNLEHVVICPTF